jgi:hypothetical protein
MGILRTVFRQGYIQVIISSLLGGGVYISLYLTALFEFSKEVKLIFFIGLFILISIATYLILFRLTPIYFQHFEKVRIVMMSILTLIASVVISFLFFTAASSLIHTRHTFELIPTAQKNDQSTGTDIIFFEMRDEDSEIIPFVNLDPKRTWEYSKHDGLNALIASNGQGDPIVYSFYGSEGDAIQVLLKSTTGSGIALVRLDNYEQVVDLFDQDEGDTILSLQVNYKTREKIGLFLIYSLGFLFLLLCFWGLWIIIDMNTQYALSNSTRNVKTFFQNSFSGKYQLADQIIDMGSTPKTRGMLILLAFLLFISIALIFRFQKIIPFSNDEYSYMLNYEYPERFSIISGYGYLMPTLVFWSQPDIYTYRIVSLLLDLALVLKLTLMTIKWVENWSENSIQSGQKQLFTVMGFSAVITKYSLLRFTPGYVDLANWVTLIVVICFLGVLISKSQKYSLLRMLIAGLTVGFGFFAKQPTSVALVSVVVVAITIIYAESRRKSIQGVQLLGIFAAGAMLAALLFFATAMPLSVWLERTNTALSDHPPADYLGRYWQEIKNLITIYLVGFYPILLLAFLASSTNTLYSRIRFVKLISRIFIFTAAAFPVFLLVLDHFWYERSSFIFLQHITTWFGNWIGDEYFYPFSVIFTRGTLVHIVLGMILAGYLLGTALDPQTIFRKNNFIHSFWEKREIWVVISVMLLLPFAPVSGSSEPLLYYALQSNWTWIMAFIIIYTLFHPKFSLFGNWLFVFLPSILVFTHFYSAIDQINNYQGGLLGFSLSRMENLPKGGNLLFPEPVAQALRDSEAIMVQGGNFSPGDTVFSYSPLYVTYFIGGVPPSGHTHWHPYFFAQGLDNNCSLIQLGESELQSNAYIIESYGGMPDEIIDCLATIGIAFPQDYVELGSLIEPDSNEEIKFYAPREQ